MLYKEGISTTTNYVIDSWELAHTLKVIIPKGQQDKALNPTKEARNPTKEAQTDFKYPLVKLSCLNKS